MIEKKIEQVCEIHYFRENIRIVYRISGLKVATLKK